jgi:Ca2+-binding EF-hand superfamily protein
MKKLKTLGLSFIVMGLFITPALAEAPEQKGPGKAFEKADTNNDGITTKEEYLAYHAKRFDEIDKDGDGKIEKQDLKEHMQSRREQKQENAFNKIDQDGDGQVSKEELMKFQENIKETRQGRRMTRQDKPE